MLARRHHLREEKFDILPVVQLTVNPLELELLNISQRAHPASSVALVVGFSGIDIPVIPQENKKICWLSRS